MKSRAMRVSAILAMAIFISIATAYLAMSRLYAGRFGYGIWVNGVYATGLKPAEVTEILDGQAEGDGGLPVPDYIDENVSSKVVRIIQSYTGVVNKMVWRKEGGA